MQAMSSLMNKTYLLVYSNQMTRGNVKAWIEDCGHIRAWRYDLPNCFYVVSSESAQKVADDFLELPEVKKGRFLVTQVGKDTQGWLPKASWHIINNQELLENTE